MNSIISVNNAESYIAAAIQGLGIIQVPAYDVQNELKKGELVQILPKFRPRPVQISFFILIRSTYLFGLRPLWSGRRLVLKGI